MAAQKTNTYTTYARVWKQGSHYVWVHAATAAATGPQHATQLCFRNDGTVMRVRQALTVPALDTAGVAAGYYRSDGSLIAKTAAFVENDPAVTKRINALPYYNLLP